MEKKRNIDIVQMFYELLQECNEAFELQRKELSNMDRLKSDIEHKFELKELDEHEMAELGKEMQICLWNRRMHKDITEELEPIKRFMDKYPKIIKNLETLYNELKRVEMKHQNRYYTPRVMGLGDERWYSENHVNQENFSALLNEPNTSKEKQLSIEQLVKDITLSVLKYSEENDLRVSLSSDTTQGEDASENKFVMTNEINHKKESIVEELLEIKIDSYETQWIQLENKWNEIETFFATICKSKRGVFSQKKKKIIQRVVRKLYTPLFESYNPDTMAYNYDYLPNSKTLLDELMKENSADGVALISAYEHYLNDHHICINMT